MRLFMVLALSVIAGTSAASAQSFDCSKASKAAEFAICDSQRLSRLDEDMASLYFGLPHDIRQSIKGEQRRWLRRRNACGYDRRCIARAYRRRIDRLANY